MDCIDRAMQGHMRPLDRVVRAGHGTDLGDLHLVSVDDILDCIHVLVLDERIQEI